MKCPVTLQDSFYKRLEHRNCRGGNDTSEATRQDNRVVVLKHRINGEEP